MNADDPDGPDVKSLTRYQYNAMLLEPPEHSIQIKDADLTHDQTLKEFTRQLDEGRITFDEAFEQLKQIGVLF
jgi:hypothetical protein